jgi:hypothetical protein
VQRQSSGERYLRRSIAVCGLLSSVEVEQSQSKSGKAQEERRGGPAESGLPVTRGSLIRSSARLFYLLPPSWRLLSHLWQPVASFIIVLLTTTTGCLFPMESSSQPLSTGTTSSRSGFQRFVVSGPVRSLIIFFYPGCLNLSLAAALSRSKRVCEILAASPIVRRL